MSNKIEGMNILICGSQQFDDVAFVFNTLNTLFEQTRGNVRKIFTSKFAGACEFAGTWANIKNEELPEDKKIAIVEYSFDKFLTKKNQSIYDQLEIPEFAVKNDKFFQDGKDLLISKGINLVVAFPNKDGILGASTRNINRFASLAEIKSFDCSLLLNMVNSYRENESNVVDVIQKDQEKNQNLGFNNRHPNKR